MNKEKIDHNLQLLLRAFLSLESTEACANFLEDLCTVNELHAMSQRFAVARMLRQKHVYADIVAKTGASTATISRVNRSLLYGSDGYLAVLDNLDKTDENGGE